MKSSGEVSPISEVAAMLELARKMEEGSVRDNNLWANECAANADSASKKIFEQLVTDEEAHYDQLITNWTRSSNLVNDILPYNRLSAPYL